MASITLDRLWIHDAADLDQYLTVIADAEQANTAVVGEVRTYAGGRRRLVRRADTHGRPDMLMVRCEQVDRDTLDQLNAWCGRRLVFRDPRGRLWWGVYWELDIDEVPHQDEELADVAFVVERLSGTPEV